MPQRIRETHTGETARKFAIRCGMLPQALSRYEAGGNIPSAEVLRRICVASGVSSDWILGLSERKERAQEQAPEQAAPDNSALLAIIQRQAETIAKLSEAVSRFSLAPSRGIVSPGGVSARAEG